MKLSEETSRQCAFAITGGNFSGYYQFKHGFTVLPIYPQYFEKKSTEQRTKFSERTDKLRTDEKMNHGYGEKNNQKTLEK